MYTKFVGLDPSLSAFGIAVIDTDKKQIILDQRKAHSHHDFVLMSWSIANLYNNNLLVLKDTSLFLELS